MRVNFKLKNEINGQKFESNLFTIYSIWVELVAQQIDLVAYF